MNSAFRLRALLAAAPALLGIVVPAGAQSLDGNWRGATSGTPSGGNCRPFTFDITVRADSVTGMASTPHTGAPVQWKVIGLVDGGRISLIVELTDQRLRNPSTRWRGEPRTGALYLEQIGSKACNPTRSGTLKKS